MHFFREKAEFANKAGLEVSRLRKVMEVAETDRLRLDAQVKSL